jgi:hypothetical protein
VRIHRLTSASLAVALVTLMALGGCSLREPNREGLETAIPTALLATDLGITRATAENGVDGLAVTVTVNVWIDGSAISADDLREILRVIVDNTNLTHVAEIEVGAYDDTAPAHTTIDLGAVGEELGFPRSRILKEYFHGDWDDVVELLQS